MRQLHPILSSHVALAMAVVLSCASSFAPKWGHAQAIDVSSFCRAVDPDHRGAELAEVHPAYDADPQACDFGGQRIPAVWRSNGLVTGLMGISRFGPAYAAYLAWGDGSAWACPPFRPVRGQARMTRMQSDAITVEYEPFAGVKVTQTSIAASAHLLRVRARVTSPRECTLDVALLGGIVEQTETGRIQWKPLGHPRPLSELSIEDRGVFYEWRLRQGGTFDRVDGFDAFAPAIDPARQGPVGRITSQVAIAPGIPTDVEFCLAIAPDPAGARAAAGGAFDQRFDALLTERRARSEAFAASIPKFDFHDRDLNLFHRIQWERLRALAENGAGAIPWPYFMGTSAPWGIDGLWLWDAAFQSQVLQYAQPAWAQHLIEDVLAQQGPDGIVPHWSTPHSRTAISQPPLLSWAARRLYLFHGDRAFLERVYPGLCALHRWFIRARTRADGLPFWKQPDESGMDNSPAFDAGTDAHVDLAAELLSDAQDLAGIATLLGKPDEERAWRAQAETWRARLDRYWDPGARFYFPLKGPRRVPVYTNQGFFALGDERMSADRRAALLARLQDPTQFWPKFPVPSTSLVAPEFMQPKWFANTYDKPEAALKSGGQLQDFSSVYWRGPVWIFSNAIILAALRRSGLIEVADALSERMVTMMEEAARHGGMLWENFDPRDGMPSRLLPRGQSDEMAASIFYLQALYDARMCLEPDAPPRPERLSLRYTAVPTADVRELRFGPYTLDQAISPDGVDVRVRQAPRASALVTITNASQKHLRVRIGLVLRDLAPGEKVSGCCSLASGGSRTE